MARSLRDRLIFDLERNRRELIQVAASIDDLGYAPAPGMKTYRDQLVEIGATEAETVAFLSTCKVPQWKELEARVTGTTAAELLHSLETLRAEVLLYLDSISDLELSEPVEVPKEWVPVTGDDSLEREELLRWLARHEYYHLGQIITYRWIQGFNPYK